MGPGGGGGSSGSGAGGHPVILRANSPATPGTIQDTLPPALPVQRIPNPHVRNSFNAMTNVRKYKNIFLSFLLPSSIYLSLIFLAEERLLIVVLPIIFQNISNQKFKGP